MSNRQVRPNQLIDATSWHGYTERNHLFTTFQDRPDVYMGHVAKIWDENLGEDFVSMVESHGTEYIDRSSDGRYEWSLSYMIDTNYECLGAWEDADGTVAIAADARLGVAGTSWYMDFQGNPFSPTEIIAGENPNVDRVYVAEEFAVGADMMRYRMQHSYARSNDDYLDGVTCLPGTRWSEEAGLVSDYWSDRGVDISFRTPSRAYGYMSNFRLQHRIAGHMLDGYRPKYFYITDPASGKIIDKPFWISNVEFEFLRKIRQIRAHLLQYGRTNEMADGKFSLKADNGYDVRAGSGWNEQVLSSNVHVYPGTPSLNVIEDVIQSLVVGKMSLNSRSVIIKAGEYGLAHLSKTLHRTYGSGAYTPSTQPWMGDTTGRAYKWEGNNVTVNYGQVMGVAMMNGISVRFVLDPSKDNPKRNKVMMGNGLNGFASSYQYDIILLGNGDENANYKIVRREGQTPVFGVREGMRGLFPKSSSFTDPKAISSALDGSEIHFMEVGIGAKVNDPTKVLRYYPAILPE